MERRYYYYQRDERRVPAFCLCLLLGIMVTIVLCVMPMMLYEANPTEVARRLRDTISDYQVKLAFEGFKQDYGKSYKDQNEEDTRRAIFAENYRKIIDFNSEKHNFELGVNQFADLTQEEFSRFYLSKPEPVDLSSVDYDAPLVNPDNEESKDWVDEGKVSPIRDQGHCGSCWTFSAIAATESLYAIKENITPVALSEQQLVDCCRTTLSNGCFGGERWEAFEYITRVGIAKRANYPYEAMNDICRENEVEIFMHLNNYTNVTKGSSSALAEAVRIRPVSVGINASPFVFMFYKGGIIDEGCPADVINHGVVAVGVGEKDGIRYWRVRNSWGAKWGDHGYVYIKREVENGPGLCAIAMKGCMPRYPDEF